MGKNKYFAEGKDSWAVKLYSALNPHKANLESLQSYTLQSINLNKSNIKQTIKKIFDDLSKPGPEGLSQRSDRESFPVGASKILHFILPDLFIILDSNARRELNNFYGFPKGKIDKSLYLEAIRIYQRELKRYIITDDG